MPLLVACPCGATSRADERFAGQESVCVLCGKPLRIGGPPVGDHDVFISYSSRDRAVADFGANEPCGISSRTTPGWRSAAMSE